MNAYICVDQVMIQLLSHPLNGRVSKFSLAKRELTQNGLATQDRRSKNRTYGNMKCRKVRNKPYMQHKSIPCLLQQPPLMKAAEACCITISVDSAMQQQARLQLRTFFV